MTDNDYDNKSVAELQGDVARSKKDAELATELAAAEVVRVRQANRLRDDFFRLAVGLSVGTVATSILLVIAVIFGATVQTSVAVAFISGLAIETIGVLAVMGNYLFPPKEQKQKS